MLGVAFYCFVLFVTSVSHSWMLMLFEADIMFEAIAVSIFMFAIQVNYETVYFFLSAFLSFPFLVF